MQTFARTDFPRHDFPPAPLTCGWRFPARNAPDALVEIAYNISSFDEIFISEIDKAENAPMQQQQQQPWQRQQQNHRLESNGEPASSGTGQSLPPCYAASLPCLQSKPRSWGGRKMGNPTRRRCQRPADSGGLRRQREFLGLIYAASLACMGFPCHAWKEISTPSQV